MTCTMCNSTGRISKNIGHSGRVARFECPRCRGESSIQKNPVVGGMTEAQAEGILDEMRGEDRRR